MHPARIKITLRGPVVTLATGAGAILLAALMDQRPGGAPFGALVVGALGLHVLLPVGLVWLLIAVVRRLRHDRDGAPPPASGGESL